MKRYEDSKCRSYKPVKRGKHSFKKSQFVSITIKPILNMYFKS